MRRQDRIMDDQRAFERFELRVPATLGIEGPEREKEDISLLTSNICAGGAFFQTEEPLPQGTRVRMEFTLSIDKLKEMLASHCRIKVRGEVVRTDASGIAVCFDEDYEIMPVKEALH
jgi:hypothetical protein